MNHQAESSVVKWNAEVRKYICRWDKLDNMNARKKAAKTPSTTTGSAVAAAAAVAAVSLHLFHAESPQKSPVVTICETFD